MACNALVSGSRSREDDHRASGQVTNSARSATAGARRLRPRLDATAQTDGSKPSASCVGRWPDRRLSLPGSSLPAEAVPVRLVSAFMCSPSLFGLWVFAVADGAIRRVKILRLRWCDDEESGDVE